MAEGEGGGGGGGSEKVCIVIKILISFFFLLKYYKICRIYVQIYYLFLSSNLTNFTF